MVEAVAEQELEVTEEMISAASAVLFDDPFLGLGPSAAEAIARKILDAAFLACRTKIDGVDHSTQKRR